MAKWNRRQFLSGLLAATTAEATVLTRDALALTRPGNSLAPGQNAKGLASVPAVPSVPPVATGAGAEGFEVSLPGLSHAADGDSHELQRMLPAGLRFGHWRIVEVLAVKLGAVPVILETRHGVRFQVDILRRDRRGHAKRGIAETRFYALYLANLGRGTKPTREEHGVGLIWLAALMRPREGRYGRPALLSLRERLARFPSGRFDALASTTAPTESPTPRRG